jgi:hypothetical protein
MHALVRFRAPSAAARVRPFQPRLRLALVLHKRALSSARSLQQSIDRRFATLVSMARERKPASAPARRSAGSDIGRPGASPVALLSLEDAAHERDLRRFQLGQRRASQKRRSPRSRVCFASTNPRSFTEHRDTLTHVQASMVSSRNPTWGDSRRASRSHQIVHNGGCLLLATDAAGEGLNLQLTCRLVINLNYRGIRCG